MNDEDFDDLPPCDGREPARALLSVNQTNALLKSAEWKVAREVMCDQEDWHNAYLMHDGRWLYVTRTDLVDDVDTYSDMAEFKDNPIGLVAYWIEENRLGARVYDDHIAIIDQGTDG